MRQLFAALRPTSTLTLYGGKIHPNFGWAYANVPGNFYNFASDYEEAERIGFGVEYWLPAEFGLDNARVSLETHYLDTTLLSTSLLSQPRVPISTSCPGSMPLPTAPGAPALHLWRRRYRQPRQLDPGPARRPPRNRPHLPGFATRNRRPRSGRQDRARRLARPDVRPRRWRRHRARPPPRRDPVR